MWASRQTRLQEGHNERSRVVGEAKVRARGTRGQNWYTEKRVSFLRSKVRTQSSWLLHLAGDFHVNFETKPLLHTQHLMRCMLTSNLAVDQRFANGTHLVVRVFLFVGRARRQEPDESQRREAETERMRARLCAFEDARPVDPVEPTGSCSGEGFEESLGCARFASKPLRALREGNSDGKANRIVARYRYD